MLVGQGPDGLGDIKSSLTANDDPAFARRYIGKRFVFVSAHDSDDRTEICTTADKRLNP